MAVYFIKDMSTNYIKVGYSADAHKRLRALQTGNPSTLSLVAQIENGTMDIEREIHNGLDAHRIRGEWFSISDSDVFELCVEYSAARAAPEKQTPEARQLAGISDDTAKWQRKCELEYASDIKAIKQKHDIASHEPKINIRRSLFRLWGDSDVLRLIITACLIVSLLVWLPWYITIFSCWVTFAACARL